MPPAHRLVESGSQCAKHLVGGSRRAAVLLHLAGQFFDVLRGQLLQTVGADAGDEMDVDRDAIPGWGVLSDVRDGDVL
jgi:hypothetical protein